MFQNLIEISLVDFSSLNDKENLKRPEKLGNSWDCLRQDLVDT